MDDANSLNHSIDDAKKHYRSMFTLPSLKTVLSAVGAVCFVVGLLVYTAVPAQGIWRALLLAFSIFILAISADLTISKVLLKNDQIFSLRRTLVVSLFGLVFWIVFLIIGAVLAHPFGWQWWARMSLLGFASVITLRIIVFMATSGRAAWRKGVAVLLQPMLCLAPFVVFWFGISSRIPTEVLPFIVLSPIVALLSALLFFYPIQRLGKSYSISSIPLFRAFMVDWVAGDNAPLERLFEEMGEDTDVEVEVLKFESSKPNAAIVLSQVHPGPFSNIGSSLLPAMMKHEFQKEYKCETCTPLGILGHERDLASQTANRKIVSQVIASANFKTSADLASPFVRVSEGAASACCQVFGDTAFISFTLAPETTEDLPQELGRIVSDEAAKYGLKHAVVVNTHNSLTDVVDVEEHLDTLREVASKCLQKAVTQPKGQFKVGAASVYPPEFTYKAGMGSGGITALVVEVQKQKTAYVVIDGNNMVSGLREKLLASLASMGFSESEIFTTDTHVVTAIVTGRRGYHPVGEQMNQELLTRIICDAAKKAEGALEASTVGCLELVVPKVRAIGEERLESMTTLVNRAIQRIKQVLVPTFGLEGLILVLILAFLWL